MGCIIPGGVRYYARCRDWLGNEKRTSKNEKQKHRGGL